MIGLDNLKLNLGCACVAAMLAVPLCAGAASAAEQAAASEVAFVEALSGRVVALADRSPVLLDALDVIRDRTRLDLQAGSELSICHYRTHRLVTLKGPARAFVSAEGVVTAENGKPVVASGGTCNKPAASTYQGGIVTRGFAARH
jgi:hypothetical protein